MAEEIRQRTKCSSPLHSKKRRSSTTLLLPFTLLNLPYGHHSAADPPNIQPANHYMKNKAASSLAQHICKRISVVTQGNYGQIKAEQPRKIPEARGAAF